MRENIKARWVAALRSGVYEQGQSCLKTSDGKYCCLGVLMQLAVHDGVAFEEPQGGSSRFHDVAGLNASAHVLTPGVQKWAGLDDPIPGVRDRRPGGREVIVGLSVLNDVDGLSFPQIADRIEEQL